jgi:hypothetical protein
MADIIILHSFLLIYLGSSHVLFPGSSFCSSVVFSGALVKEMIRKKGLTSFRTHTFIMHRSPNSFTSMTPAHFTKCRVELEWTP